MAEGFADIEESLTKKIGGLPGYAWVGIAVGGVFAYKKFKGGSSSLPAPSTSVTDSSSPANMQVPSQVQTLPAGTNAAWAATAANQLMATSSYSPADIQTALANYQSGNGLTGTQQSIIDSVLHTFGTPPEGVIPVVSAQPDTSSISAINSTAVATPPPTAGGNTPSFAQDTAGTQYTGGTVNSAGAIAGATDTAGNKVFIPAPSAPSISSTYVPTPTPAPRTATTLAGNPRVS